MEFKKEDFSPKFRSQFSEEEFKILMDFCESYNKRFGQYTTKQEIINKISTLGAFTHYSQENDQAIAAHLTTPSADYTKIHSTHIRTNDARYEKLSVPEKKAILYHELIHHFSALERGGSLIQCGLGWGNKTEPTYLDEVMTEFYATELLRMENINITKHLLAKEQTKVDLSRETIQFDGAGYQTISGLGKTFDAILGKKIFDGKTKNFGAFQVGFNQRFKNIAQMPAISFIDKQIYDAFNTPGTLQDSTKRKAVYDCYKTALDIFEIDRQHSYEKNGFDLHDYLRRSNRVMKSLPTQILSTFTMDKTRGIPDELFDRFSEIDRNIIIQYIRPDILQIQDEEQRNREINKLSSVINILRENIGSLTQEDIQQISYGKIDEYTHNGLDCLVIRAGDKAFQTFVNNSTELNGQFMPYCSFKTPERYDKLYDTNTDQQMRQTFAEAGHQLGDTYTMSTVMNVGGEHAMYGLVENNGTYYKTSGELQEVQIVDEKTISLNPRNTEKKEEEPKQKPQESKPYNNVPNKKMIWIQKFLDNYDSMETSSQFEYREIYEADNTLQVLRAIEKGEFIGEGLSKIKINKDSSEFEIEQSISKIARLLKAASNITIDGGRNYLEEFANIPNVTEILLLIKNSESYKNMSAKAEEHRKTGTIQQHKKTKAETDKELAQEYLRSGSMSKPTVSEELAYRTETLIGASERVVDFDAKSEAEIPIDRRQKTAVERIIARQQGKVPGEIVERNGMLVFAIDTQNVQERKRNNVTPSSIVAYTLQENTGKNEINGVTTEMRQNLTQTQEQEIETK